MLAVGGACSTAFMPFVLAPVTVALDAAVSAAVVLAFLVFRA